MKKFLLLLLFVVSGVFAQETATDSTKHWTRKGVFTFLANQSSFSNWQAGGQNNFAGNVGINYDFNYKNGDWNWDNKIILAYGLTKIKGADTQKTDDRIELNSLLGKKASGEWFYSAFFNFKTQMDTGLDPATQTVKISHFFSPAYFQFGPGMLWKKSDNLKVNFAPATSKLIMVHDHFTEFGSSFGVEQGETTRYELGAAVNGYYKFNLMENVSVENTLNFYSNYLEDPQNVDIDYQLNIVMKINKFLSTNFAFQTIYDDNAFRGFQTKQIIGLGLNYGF
ncbi:DUF3078 domain-containing protein [Flavobacterium sp. N2820]|jgi:hypothetical protein|uniref:DUF3078 domain-containing protein n=1 Tax=Flavobacterium sp. N2820 TaxID=2986834 RepID=UPI00222577E2|nr:DUF3078 domain-containing protein [Flavobacterium sp. N2820]